MCLRSLRQRLKRSHLLLAGPSFYGIEAKLWRWLFFCTASAHAFALAVCAIAYGDHFIAAMFMRLAIRPIFSCVIFCIALNSTSLLSFRSRFARLSVHTLLWTPLITVVGSSGGLLCADCMLNAICVAAILLSDILFHLLGIFIAATKDDLVLVLPKKLHSGKLRVNVLL